MFKYLWLLPIVLFAIYWIVVCIKNVGIKDFIVGIILSLLIGFSIGCALGFIVSVSIYSFESFFLAYNDMNEIWCLIKEWSLGTGFMGAVVVAFTTLVDDYNMSGHDIF